LWTALAVQTRKENIWRKVVRDLRVNQSVVRTAGGTQSGLPMPMSDRDAGDSNAQQSQAGGFRDVGDCPADIKAGNRKPASPVKLSVSMPEFI